MNRKYRLYNDLKTQDMRTSILIPDKVGICQMSNFCMVENEKQLWVIEGDPGQIKVCLECLLQSHKDDMTFLNGKPIDINKELNRDNDDFTKWTDNSIDEEIFNVEETMVNEYTQKCGRKMLVKYWQKLQDHREQTQNESK